MRKSTSKLTSSPKTAYNLFTRFFFSDHKAKRKSLAKRNANWGISPVATGDEGYTPSTPPPFEKGGRKLL